MLTGCSDAELKYALSLVIEKSARHVDGSGRGVPASLGIAAILELTAAPETRNSRRFMLIGPPRKNENQCTKIKPSAQQPERALPIGPHNWWLRLSVMLRGGRGSQAAHACMKSSSTRATRGPAGPF